MIDARRQAHIYRTAGLAWEQGFDDPNTKYPPHEHEATRLYTVAGSLLLTVWDDAGEREVTLTPGTEFVVASGQRHKATVGDSGWKYIAAWDPTEAALYEGVE